MKRLNNRGLFGRLIKPLAFVVPIAISLAYGSSAMAVTATASSNDGNGPSNTLDGSLSTRWSANGSGEWIKFDLGSVQTVDDLDIAFFKGDQRSATIEVQVSTNNSTWTTAFYGTQSQSTTGLQNFNVTDTAGRYVKIIGYGNTLNTWNSFTEVEINTIGGVSPTPTPTPTPTPAVSIGVTSSSDDGNVAANTLDNNINTRWSANGSGQWIQYDLGSSKVVNSLDVAFYKGDQRQAIFDVLVSNSSNSGWSTVFSGVQPSLTSAQQSIDVTNTTGRYVRIVGYGNSSNTWNSLTEVDINTGGNVTPTPTPTPTPTVTPTPTNGSAIPSKITDGSLFDLEGSSPHPLINSSTLSFVPLQAQVTTSNGNGWRHEYKIKSSLRVAMADTYELFKATIKVDMSTGGKTIVAQHHASDTGTIMKLYVSDSSESGFDDSTASNGIFDVYVRIRNTSGVEEKKPLGTIRSGDSFSFEVINNYGTVTVSAFGKNLTTEVEDSSESYLKFGNYLQSQYPQGSVDCGNSGDSDSFAECYRDIGITKSTVTMTNVSYTRINK